MYEHNAFILHTLKASTRLHHIPPSELEIVQVHGGAGDRAGTRRVLLQACTRTHHQPPPELEIEQAAARDRKSVV